MIEMILIILLFIAIVGAFLSIEAFYDLKFDELCEGCKDAEIEDAEGDAPAVPNKKD